MDFALSLFPVCTKCNSIKYEMSLLPYGSKSHITASTNMRHALQKKYEIFHYDRLRQVPNSFPSQWYNHGQHFISPRPAKPYSEIYPGPRVVSNIDELIGQEMVEDPKTGQLRKAFRVHVNEREMDDWVWADDLRMDKRYTNMVVMFEDSIATFWEKVMRDYALTWKDCKKAWKTFLKATKTVSGDKKCLSWDEVDGEAVILFT